MSAVKTPGVVDVLREGLELYKSSPSHAPEDRAPARGCFCVVTALSEGSSSLRAGHRIYAAAEDALTRHMGLSLAQFNAEHSTAVVVQCWERAVVEEMAALRHALKRGRTR